MVMAASTHPTQITPASNFWAVKAWTPSFRHHSLRATPAASRASSRGTPGCCSASRLPWLARAMHVSKVSRATPIVMGTDKTGVIENAMLHTTSENRSSGSAALNAHARAALDSGIGTDLGAIALQLQRGNDLETDPMARTGGTPEARSGERPTYACAQVKGGWLGLVEDRGEPGRSRVEHNHQLRPSELAPRGGRDRPQFCAGLDRARAAQTPQRRAVNSRMDPDHGDRAGAPGARLSGKKLAPARSSACRQLSISAGSHANTR